MPSPISTGSKKGVSLPCKRYAVGGTSSVGVLAKSSARISTRALRPDVPSSLRKYCASSEKRTTHPFVRYRVILTGGCGLLCLNRACGLTQAVGRVSAERATPYALEIQALTTASDRRGSRG